MKRARDPFARQAAPRHCSVCGRGLTQRTRADLTAEERLLLAIFNRGALCERCAPTVLAKL